MKKIMSFLILCGFTCIVYTKFIAIADLFNFVEIAKFEVSKDQGVIKVLCSPFSLEFINTSTESVRQFIIQIVLK